MVLVLPPPVEGFGTVILEAAAQGTAAVVSEGAPDEVVIDGCDGTRVPFAHPSRLAEAMSLLLRSPHTQATLSREAVGSSPVARSSRYGLELR